MDNKAKYSINVAWSEKDQCFLATSPIFGGLIATGDTREEALREAEIGLEGIVETLQAHNEILPDPDIHEPYSGQFRLRIPKSLHRRLAENAAREGVSLNQYVVSRLSSSDTEDKITRIVTTIIYNHPTINIQQSQDAMSGSYPLGVPENKTSRRFA